MKGEIKLPWWKCRSRSPPSNPKGLQVLVAKMGDLVILSFAIMEERVEAAVFTRGGRRLFIPLSDF
jgi:hypothetical protein